ncbi:type VI secretion system tip protein VgrG [Trinickia symbiotica]|uniref:Type VI secretion system tip protein VgrG n=1 Tax=Trinickia symbiotica TaxID=863227 RepID=A0A2T3XX67_9BURK|nr:type VI secretion system Vgr family protein [Trinickia symbiotica]PTB21094.1 type VI secretion system tip protein VgrG [Trinickia symbiotica]
MDTRLSARDLRTLASGLQHNRLLKLKFPKGDAPHDVLVVNRLEGNEFLSRDFKFAVEILSDSAQLDVNDFTGRLISVELLRNDGSVRYFSGYIFAFLRVKTDGGIAFYEAQVGPWLRYLKYRKNNRVLRDMGLRGQTATLFQDYGALPVWDWRVREADPPMTMACQFDEDDHNYLHRRWEHAGLTYWYEHAADSHQLIVADPTRVVPAIDGETPAIQFQSEAGSLEADGIASWSPIQRVTSTHTALTRADFKNPGINPGTVSGVADAQIDGWNGRGPKLEWYEYAGAYGYRDSRDGARQAARRIDAIAAGARQFAGAGNSRFLMPGRWFRLIDHYGSSLNGARQDSEFLIVSVRHVATNNYLQGTGAAATYRNEFTCVSRSTPWRPPRGYSSVDTRILAPQTATVVGPPGESLYTDEHGRCLVRFQWDREGTNTTWVRVSSAWAGGSQGMVALPRIGSEVIVQWLDGNPDRPVITGRVMNAKNLAAWQLPQQRALTGIRSRELNGDAGNAASGRSNHLLFDDTVNAIQTQLRSDHAASQLSLGCITRIENWWGRQDARGEGFELRTDAVGAIRSGKGMLVSTEVRPLGKAHISDVSEPASRLAKAGKLQEQLGKLAQQHQAQDSGADQTCVADALQSQVNGIKGTGGVTSDGSFPELDEAHLLLAGAAGTAITTPATAHVTGGQHVAITSGENVSLATGKSLLASVSEKFSVFAHRMGMKLIAASGKVQVQAQNDDLELLAKKVVSIISTTDWINLTAKQGIRLHAGNSELVISADGIKGFTPGEHIVHAGNHGTMGPQSIPASFPGADLCSSLSSGAAQSGAASVALT